MSSNISLAKERLLKSIDYDGWKQAFGLDRKEVFRMPYRQIAELEIQYQEWLISDNGVGDEYNLLSESETESYSGLDYNDRQQGVGGLFW